MCGCVGECGVKEWMGEKEGYTVKFIYKVRHHF